MPKYIEKLLETQINEYRRKSKTVLIVYHCRYNGIVRTHTKTKGSRDQSKYCPDDKTQEKNEIKNIAGTISGQCSNPLEFKISGLFSKSSNSSESLHASTTSTSCSSSEVITHDNFPYKNSKLLKPLLYWNIEANSYMPNSGGTDKASRKKKLKKPQVQLDAISNLRLRNFIRSLCENRNNYDICRPCPVEEDINGQPTRRKKKSKKSCKCIEEPSTISFHFTMPNQTKSIILKNNPTAKSKKKRNRPKNSPSSTHTSNSSSGPPYPVSSGEDSGNYTMKVGKQTITISMRKTGDNEESKNATEEKPDRTTCEKRFRPNHKENKCECLQRIKKNMEEDIKNYVLSQLNTCSTGNTNTCAFASRSQVKNARENQKKFCDESFIGGCECEEMENLNNYTQCNCSESYNDNYELSEGIHLETRYPQCVRIYVDPQIEYGNENREVQINEHSKSQKKNAESEERNIDMCDYKKCPAIYGRGTTRPPNERKNPHRILHPCRAGMRKYKCCFCSENPEEDTCPCPDSLRKQQKNQCCQCNPNQEKDTQVDITLNQTTDTKESTEDITGDNVVNEGGTQPKRNSVAETYVANTAQRSNKNLYKSTADSSTNDGSCLCSISDEDSCEEIETVEIGCEVTESEDDEDDEISFEQRARDQSCECDFRMFKNNLLKPILKIPCRLRQFKSWKNSHSCNIHDNNDKKQMILSDRKKSVKQKVTSTADLKKCECDDFEQLIAELDEYCKAKCVNFEVRCKTDLSGFQNKCREISKTEKSVYVTRSDQRRPTTSNLCLPSLLSESSQTSLHINNSATELQYKELSRAKNDEINVISPYGRPKYRWPRKTSSKLSDQRINKIKKIESRYKKSGIEEKIEFLIL